jgi:hypothetical protein
MWTRRATLKSLDPTDYEKLPNFVHELRTHSMYRPVIEDLKSQQGFVKKEYLMRDDKEGQTFFSTISFDSKENFDCYINEEANQSLWVYLELMAVQSDISIEIEDKEDTV